MKSERGTSYLEFLFILLLVVLPLSYAVFELLDSIRTLRMLIRGVLLHPFP